MPDQSNNAPARGASHTGVRGRGRGALTAGVPEGRVLSVSERSRVAAARGRGGSGTRSTRGTGRGAFRIRPTDERGWLAAATPPQSHTGAAMAGPSNILPYPQQHLGGTLSGGTTSSTPAIKPDPYIKQEGIKQEPSDVNLAGIPFQPSGGAGPVNARPMHGDIIVKKRSASPADLDKYAWQRQPHLSDLRLAKQTQWRSGEPRSLEESLAAYKAKCKTENPQNSLATPEKFTTDMLLWEADRTQIDSMSVLVFEIHCRSFLARQKKQDERGQLRVLTEVEKKAYVDQAKTRYDNFVSVARTRRRQRTGGLA